MTPKLILVLAGLNGLISVAASAAGAHALKSRLSEQMLAWFTQAATFQLFHALAILALGVWMMVARDNGLVGPAAMMLQLGIVLFSGTLYWLAFNGPGSLGALHWLTPIGGLALMGGWGLVIAAGLRQG